MANYCLKHEFLTDDRKVANHNNTSEGGTTEVRVDDVVREMIAYRMLPDVRTVGIEDSPSLAEQAMRPTLRIVLESKSIVPMREAGVYCEKPERLYYEYKLGCSRGLLWALAFHTGTFVFVTVCWSLHMFLR
jgi:hypothetical protein